MKQKYAEHNISLNNLVDVLGEDENRDYLLTLTVENLLKKYGNTLYKDAVYHTTHLDLPPTEAKKLWQRMLSHKYEIGKKLFRNVGIRVAAMDYFLNVEKRIAEPKIIETALLEEIQDASGKDALTGLFNYNSFRERIHREISRSERYGKIFSLIVFDIDSFKRYNDKYGHKEGDIALKKISRIMKKCVRDSDFVGRYGGEEFVVILVETSKTQAAIVAERIRKMVSELKVEEPVTISGGIATFLIDAKNEQKLFEYADKAMYRAKAEGKNRICLFYEERRKFLRLGTSARITISKISKRSSVGQKTTTTNISAGGIAFHYHEPVPISTFVEAVVHLGRNKDIPFKGKVVRVEEIPRNTYEIGIKFLCIKEKDRERIISFIEKHKKL
ncbi:MAG: diguanylate cyclase [Planctomycetota bacterium]